MTARTPEQKAREKIRAHERYLRNKEEMLARIKMWKLDNPDKVLEAGRKYYAKNRERLNAYSKAWQKANPEKAKAAQQRNDAKRRGRYERYKMTQADYDQMLASQNGRCVICGNTDPRSRSGRFVVDHDHSCCPSHQRTCGQCVRALLCCPCNRVLGLVHDSIGILEAAVTYLRQHAKSKLLAIEPCSSAFLSFGT